MANLDWTPALRNGNRWYDRMAAALRLKDRAEREKELDKIEDDLKSLKKDITGASLFAKILLTKEPLAKSTSKVIGDILITLLFPAVRKLEHAYARGEQSTRNLHVAFALESYRLDKGRYPAKLDELAPKHLAAIPGDLYSGKALKYQPSEKGYLLYSVGVNGEDEGGRWYDDEPRGDDPRVRMPLPPRKQE